MASRVPVRVRVLPHGEGLPLPRYQTSGSAGADLVAAVNETVVVSPGTRVLVPCGIAVALPVGWEMQVRPRSGLAVKHGITVLNAPGTVDADYRGEIFVPLINLGDADFAIERGDRIAQAILAPVVQFEWQPVDALDDTERGSGGFGHTGR